MKFINWIRKLPSREFTKKEFMVTVCVGLVVCFIITSLLNYALRSVLL